VKKQFGSLSLVALVAVLAMVSWSGSLHAQQTTPDAQQPAPQSQQPPDTQATPSQPSPSQPSAAPQSPDQSQPTATPEHSAQPDASGSQEFVGTVSKQGDKYVFQEAATGTTYDIDHQDEVKKFEGKRVRVHGTLDPNAKMIHVR
jgi:cytoskeletal protein RodZ